MKILFITHPYPNYVPDLLLHGLRKLLGPDVVDHPRKQCLYDGVLGLGICPDDQRCPGWFPPDEGTVDRTNIWQKVHKNYFDIVLCDFRSIGEFAKQTKQWPRRFVIIDGEDTPQFIPPGPYVICRRETDGSDFSIPVPMALPEELFRWITAYDELPKRYSIGFLGSTNDGKRKKLVEAIAARFQNTLFQATDVPSASQPLPTGRLGREAYYQQLQQCRIVLTLAGAGYDTFRFWEHAACRAVNFASRFPLFIPHEFEDGSEIIRFSTHTELFQKLEEFLEHQEQSASVIRNMREKLFQFHLTTHRATYLIDRVGRAFG